LDCFLDAEKKGREQKRVEAKGETKKGFGRWNTSLPETEQKIIINKEGKGGDGA